MNTEDAISLLKKSKEFQTWAAKSENKESYMAHALVITESPDSSAANEFQIGYYSAKKDKITTFSVSQTNSTDTLANNPTNNSTNTSNSTPQEKVVQGEETDAFKEKGAVILALEMSKVQKDYQEAIIIAKNEIDSAGCSLGAGCNIDQNIIVLQNLKELGQVWNITLIINHVKLLNVKIDAKTGIIKQKTFTSLSNMMDEYK